MRTHQDSTWLQSWFVTVLFLTLLLGMGTQAAATPYEILIEDPGCLENHRII